MIDQPQQDPGQHHDHQHHHDHSHGHENKLFEFRSVERKKLLLSLIITLIFMTVEVVGGYLTQSIALISDAGHMFTHAISIIIGLGAIYIARNPPSHHKTFGLYRAEVLGAFINGLFLLLVVGVIVWEAALRIMDPVEVEAQTMLLVAGIGLGANLASIYLLHGSHKHDLNVKGVFYHMLGDAFSSVGIVVAAVVIYYTGWNIIDPLISIGISLLILIWAVGILRESGRVLLEMAPEGMDGDNMGKALEQEFPEVEEVFHIHLWTITPEMLVFTAHVRVKEGEMSTMSLDWLLHKMEGFLRERFGVQIGRASCRERV